MCTRVVVFVLLDVSTQPDWPKDWFLDPKIYTDVFGGIQSSVHT